MVELAMQNFAAKATIPTFRPGFLTGHTYTQSFTNPGDAPKKSPSSAPAVAEGRLAAAAAAKGEQSEQRES
jgi:hypothetical protein